MREDIRERIELLETLTEACHPSIEERRRLLSPLSGLARIRMHHDPGTRILVERLLVLRQASAA